MQNVHYNSTHICHKSYSFKHYLEGGNLESAAQKCSLKKTVLKIFEIFTGTHLWEGSFSELDVNGKAMGRSSHQRCSVKACKFIKKRLQQWVFSCEIFRKTSFEEHLQTTASTWDDCFYVGLLRQFSEQLKFDEVIFKRVTFSLSCQGREGLKPGILFIVEF